MLLSLQGLRIDYTPQLAVSIFSEVFSIQILVRQSQTYQRLNAHSALQEYSQRKRYCYSWQLKEHDCCTDKSDKSHCDDLTGAVVN